MIESEYFSTHLGRAFLGDSLELLPHLPDQSVDLICTSPPFALLRKKAYGNVHADDYIEWFMQFAHEFRRVLNPRGSLFVDIGGTWVKGVPVRSLYHFELVLRLCKPVEEGGAGFLLAQEMYWYNPAKLPTPAEWVTVRRERVKDAVNTVWWLCLDPHPKANNRGVLKEYSESQVKLMEHTMHLNTRRVEELRGEGLDGGVEQLAAHLGRRILLPQDMHNWPNQEMIRRANAHRQISP